MLVISSSCSAHFLKRRSLLLHFPTPSVPISPFRVWWSVPTLALKSLRKVSVCPGCCRNHRIQICTERAFNLIWVGHLWVHSHLKLLHAFCQIRELGIITRSFMPFESPESLVTRYDWMANPTPASRRSFLASTPEESVASTLVYTVCWCLSVRLFRAITVFFNP